MKNVLDYLGEADLALYINAVSMSGSRVSFHNYGGSIPFLTQHRHPTVEQYLTWAISCC